MSTTGNYQCFEKELLQQPDYRLAIEREIFQLVDSGATMHIVPDYIANAMVAPVPPPEPSVSVIDLDDFLLDDDFLSDDDDDEPFELPPGGPAAWVAPAAPRPPVPAVPVLDLDAFLFGVNEPVEPPPGGPARWAPPAAQGTMLPRPYGLRSSPQQMLDRIQLQVVPSYVASSNGEQERRHSELLSQSRHAFDGQGYMVYGVSAAATVPRHSRPESFNDIARQHIGRPDRILRDLQFPAPAFWPMADFGATVNVVWDTGLGVNVSARLFELSARLFYRRGFSRCTSACAYSE